MDQSKKKKGGGEGEEGQEKKKNILKFSSFMDGISHGNRDF